MFKGHWDGTFTRMDLFIAWHCFLEDRHGGKACPLYKRMRRIEVRFPNQAWPKYEDFGCGNGEKFAYWAACNICDWLGDLWYAGEGKMARIVGHKGGDFRADGTYIGDPRA